MPRLPRDLNRIWSSTQSVSSIQLSESFLLKNLLLPESRA
jgi:hypothetical protein